MKKNDGGDDDELNIVMVCHGASMAAFLMRWFKWSAEQFESLNCPENCEICVMELGSSTGEYSLAIHNDDETLKRWGLSPEMIEDQKQRAKSEEYVRKQEKSPMWYLNEFME